MSGTDVIERFCAEYHAYNNITPKRRVMQARVLRELADSAGGDVLEAGAPELRTYLATALEDRAPSTVKRDLSAIRPFFRWARQAKLIDVERFMELSDVPPPRVPEAAPRPYGRKEVTAMWADLDAKWPLLTGTGLRYIGRWQRGTSRWGRVQAHAKHLQMEAIITLALYGGLRLNEIWMLGYEDMHPDNSVVAVTSARKNRMGAVTQRPVPMFSPMRKAIDDWYEFRTLIDPPHQRPWLSLHQNHHAKAMQHRTFEMLLRKLGSGWEYHRLRHTAATEMLRARMPLEKVQKVLGHSKPEQTLKYAQLLPGDLITAAERAEAQFERAVGRVRDAAPTTTTTGDA